MITHFVETSKNLKKQFLAGLEEKAIEIDEPESGVDRRLNEEINRRNIENYVIIYDETVVLPRTQDTIPNPTLMHFTLAKYLKNEVKKAEKFLDLGCGTGFLGNYASKHLNPKELTFSDIALESLKLAIEAYKMNTGNNLNDAEIREKGHMVEIKSKEKIINLARGDMLTTLENYDGDKGISTIAPAYIPEICENFPDIYSLAALTAKQTNMTLYIAHSNMADNLIEWASKDSKLKREIIHEQKAPIDTTYVDGRNTINTDKLIEKGAEMQNNKYYHKIIISKLHE